MRGLDEVQKSIMEEAVELFCNKGVASTTLEDIAASLGTGVLQVKKHFESVEAIVAEMLTQYRGYTERSTPDKKAIEQMVGEKDAREVLHSIFYAYSPDDEAFYHKVVRVVMQEQYTDPQIRDFMKHYFLNYIETYIRYVLDKLIEAGKILPTVNSAIYAKIINSVNTVATLEYAHYNIEDFKSSSRIKRREMLSYLIDKIVSGKTQADSGSV